MQMISVCRIFHRFGRRFSWYHEGYLPFFEERTAIALRVFQARGRLPFRTLLLKGGISPLSRMSLFRIRIRELAKAQNLTLKEVANRSGVNYNTVKSYARVEAIAMADVVALIKIARVFGVTVEKLVEILEENQDVF